MGRPKRSTAKKVAAKTGNTQTSISGCSLLRQCFTNKINATILNLFLVHNDYLYTILSHLNQL